MPYETLDILRATPVPPLDPEESARRIIAGRGGYCFLLVDAFAALLVSLGFTVAEHHAAFTPFVSMWRGSIALSCVDEVRQESPALVCSDG